MYRVNGVEVNIMSHLWPLVIYLEATYGPNPISKVFEEDHEIVLTFDGKPMDVDFIMDMIKEGVKENIQDEMEKVKELLRNFRDELYDPPHMSVSYNLPDAYRRVFADIIQSVIENI